MPNLAQSLGSSYFSERMSGVLLVRDGRILSITSYHTRDNSIECHVVASPDHSGEGESVRIDADLINSYDDVSTPAMGYVRVGDHLWRATRNSSGRAAGGFLQSGVRWEPSQLTYLMQLSGAGVSNAPPARDGLMSLYFPAHNTLSEWSAMVEGELSGLVLSKDIIIEPTVRNDRDEYDVFVKGINIGALNPDMKINRYTPKENRDTIKEILAS